MYKYLSNFNTKPHIISLSETKIKGKPLTNISLPGYSFLHNNSQTNAGGVGVYIHESLRYDELDCTTDFAGCEDIWIKITCPITNNIFIIGTVYRHPTTNVQNFLDCLNLMLMKLNDTNKHFFILGDININTSPRQISSSGSDYINMLLSYGIASVIDKPTGITPSSATILDHIVTNEDRFTIVPGVIEHDLTDHYSVMVSIFLIKWIKINIVLMQSSLGTNLHSLLIVLMKIYI